MGKTTILRVLFFRSHSGREPVREWLGDQKREDRKAIGGDIKTAQYGWPLGMPLIRKLGRPWKTQAIRAKIPCVSAGAD